jgi:hypothetical protein
MPHRHFDINGVRCLVNYKNGYPGTYHRITSAIDVKSTLCRSPSTPSFPHPKEELPTTVFILSLVIPSMATPPRANIAASTAFAL